jgi:hypothetical protein
LIEITIDDEININTMVDEEAVIELKRRTRNCQAITRANLLLANIWSSTHLYIGIPNTALATLAGVSALSDLGVSKTFTAFLSITVAILTALITFLNPTAKYTSYRAAAQRYQAVADKYLILLLKSENLPKQNLLDELAVLNIEYNKVMESSPVISSWAYKRGKRDVHISLDSVVK